MHLFIKNFNFCSDIKRNMTIKEIEDDLNKFNDYFEILETRV
jgi:hypothetical protein